MRIIPTNVLLLKYKIKNTSLCDFCNMSTETNKHLFWECIHTQHFWTELTTFLETKNIHLSFSYELISFGLINFCKILTQRLRITLYCVENILFF